MRCALVEQVFVDGVAQYQRPNGSTPGPGQFAMDSARHVVLGSSPSGHAVEVSTRALWMLVRASDVTVNGFRMKHSVTTAQFGALTVGNDTGTIVYDRVTISNNVLSDTSGAVLRLWSGSGHRIIGNDISRGGQLGIGFSAISTPQAQNSIFRNNVIHDNNTEDFNWWWEAGGVKVTGYLYFLTFDANTVYGNKGPGFWTDGYVYNTTITNNAVHHNFAEGISVEISQYGTVAYNRVWENGWGCQGTNCSANVNQTGWVWGSGILSSTSGGFDIHDNIVAWNPDGINVLTQQRSDLMPPPDGTLVHNNNVFQARQPGDTNSDAVMLGWLDDGVTLMRQCVQSGSCSSYENLLYNSRAEPTYCRFEDPINACRGTLALYQADGADTGSHYISAADATALLSANAMPTSPESH
jgi:parallel beta-helix repeat protein